MSYPSIAQRIHEARFDLSAAEVVDLLTDLHRLHGTDAPREPALHAELVEQCVDTLFDLFALDQVPSAVVSDIVDDLVADWATATPDARAAMVAALNALGQAHPIPALLERPGVPAAELLGRLARQARPDGPASTHGAAPER